MSHCYIFIQFHYYNSQLLQQHTLFGFISSQSVMEANLVPTVTTNAGIACRMDIVITLTAPVWMDVIQGIMEPNVQWVKYARIMILKKWIFSIFLRKQTLHIMVNGKLLKKIIIFQISNWNIFNSKIPKGWN